jgi:uncharacterized protein YjiS (DUF1127 family)
MHYRRIICELAPLDEDVLQGIGLPRWDMGTYSHQRAALRWPVRSSLKTSLSEVAAALWRAVERDRERRRTNKALMMLNDRALKDIGLYRCQVPWIIEELVRHMSDFDDVATARRPAARDVEGTGIGRKPSRKPAPVGAVTDSSREMPANDDRMRKAS